MAWIESHQTLRNHPKLKKAARMLHVQRITMIGALHCLWWWALDYAQDGSLSSFDVYDIADAAGWEGDEQELYDVLVKTGFIEIEDGEAVIHDWYEYAGKLMQRREKNAERMRKSRAEHKKKRATHVQRTSQTRVKLHNQPTQPNNQPERAHENGFGDFYDAWLQKTTRADSSGSDGASLQTIYDQWSPTTSKEELIECIKIASIQKGQAATPSYLNGILRKRAIGSGKGTIPLFTEAEA